MFFVCTINQINRFSLRKYFILASVAMLYLWGRGFGTSHGANGILGVIIQDSARIIRRTILRIRNKKMEIPKGKIYSLRRDGFFMNSGKAPAWPLLAFSVIIAGVFWPLILAFLVAIYSRFFLL